VDRRQQRFAREEQIARLVCDAVPGLSFDRKSESPDALLLHADGRRIGLEVAGVVSEATLATASFRETARAAVEAELRTRRIEKRLRVYFDATELHRRPMARGAARTWLREMPVTILSIAEGAVSGERWSTDLRSLGLEYVAGLRWSPSSTPGVSSGYQAWGEHALAAGILQSKNALLASYRANHPMLDEVWLALEGIFPGMIDFGLDELGQDAFESGFERVFVVEGPRRGRDEAAKEVLRDVCG
jgi:hypothetical protein